MDSFEAASAHQDDIGGLCAFAAGTGQRVFDHRAGVVPRGGARRLCFDDFPPGAHPSVPPTVMASNRMVGSPTPTGTLWPSLPQVPTP